PFIHRAAPRTHLYTLSLHDALPISSCSNNSESNENEDKETVRIGATPWTSTTFPSEVAKSVLEDMGYDVEIVEAELGALFASLSDRKSTRLNSSHVSISYAVFCLKK